MKFMSTLSALSIRVVQPPALPRMGLKIALLAAFTLPAYAGLIIPSSLWGGGSGTVYSNVPNYHGPSLCYLNASVTQCSENISSNLPPPSNPFLDQNTGMANSFGEAIIDAAGAHLLLSGSATGEGNIETTAYVAFGDQIINNTSAPEFYQIGVHVDATLFVRASGSVTFSATGVNTLYQGAGGFGTYQYVNQDSILTGTIAPNSSAYWNVVMQGDVQVSSSPSTLALYGLPSAFVDAGNTLSVTSYSVMDAGGNPVQASDATSASGFALNSISSVPEPASALLFASAALFLALAGKGRFR